MNRFKIPIPIAPLKLASLEGCRDFANLVDKHLSDFRHENPSHTKDSIAYRGYLEDSYLIDCAARVSVPAKPKES